MTVPHDLSTSSEEIRAHLSIATDEQVEQFVTQIRRLKSLEEYLALYPEDQKIGNVAADYETVCNKYLDYRRVYKIAVIGVSGAGKSSLTNVLLGKDYSPVTDWGGAATGAAIQFFFDNQKAGTAEVDYHTPASIRKLVQDYLLTLEELRDQRIQLPKADEIEQLRQVLQQINTSSSAKGALLELVDDYLKHFHNNKQQPRGKFNLENTQEKELFYALLLEAMESEVPTSLVAVARCYVPIRAADPKADLVNLPPNCCLVDLPGTGGEARHEIVIREGVRDADAVVFLTRPRQGQENDEKILGEVRQYVMLGALEDSDRVFLVINQLDNTKIDEPLKHPKFKPFLEKLIAMTLPNDSRKVMVDGSHPRYFPVSTKLAHFAQEAQLGRSIEQPASYLDLARWVKHALGPLHIDVPEDIKQADHAALFAASKVPDLTRQLNQFAQTKLIATQLRSATQTLNRIFVTITNDLREKRSELTGDQGSAYIVEQREKILIQRQYNAEEAIRLFTRARLQERKQLEQQLKAKMESFAGQIDKVLIEQLPEIWRENYMSGEYDRYAEDLPMPKIINVIGKVELLVLGKLSTLVPGVAETLVGMYIDALEKESLTATLSQQYFQHRLCHDLIALLRERVDGDGEVVSLKEQLRRIGARVAAIKLLDQDNSFIARDSLDDASYEAFVIYDMLKQVGADYRRDADQEAFKPFVAAVREHYFPLIHEECARALLNIYEYEVLVIRELLTRRLRLDFAELRERREPMLNEQIAQLIPGLGEVERLERKLDSLSSIGNPAAANGMGTVPPESLSGQVGTPNAVEERVAA